jgi:hypothetical protein
MFWEGNAYSRLSAITHAINVPRQSTLAISRDGMMAGPSRDVAFPIGQPSFQQASAHRSARAMPLLVRCRERHGPLVERSISDGELSPVVITILKSFLPAIEPDAALNRPIC